MSQSADEVEVRCADGVACVETVARYVAAARSRRAGFVEVADELERRGDRYADEHGLWRQLDEEVSS